MFGTWIGQFVIIIVNMQGFLVHINFGGSSFDQSTFFHLFCAKEAMCSFADCFKNSNEGRKVIIGDEEFQ